MACGNGCGCPKAKLSPCALGLTFGILNALYLLVFAWSAMIWGYGSQMIVLIADIYPGYAATHIGGALGAGWGFLDGAVFGVLGAWIYNFFSHCCCKKTCGINSGK